MKRRSLYPSWDSYLDRLVPRLLEIAVAVHDEGPDEVRRLVMQARRMAAPRGVDPVEGLVVGLAALIDVTKSPAELFAEVDKLVPVAGVWKGLRRPHRAVPVRSEVVRAVLAGEQPYEVLRGRERGVVVLAWQRAQVPMEEIMRRTGQTRRQNLERMVARAAAWAA
jgi:hypothetical protein